MTSGKWLEAYSEKKELTRCPVDLSTYFSGGRIAGREVDVMSLGTCSMPSGRLIVRDPLTYLADPHEKPYMDLCPKGSFPVDAAVVISDGDDCDRYAAVRMRFKDSEPVSFYEALVGYEDIYRMNDGEYFGFQSDSGLACICDEDAHIAFCEWIEEMTSDNPDFDLYGDVLEEVFLESYRSNPDHQRESGDWTSWTIPGTDMDAVLVQTGFGDGAYPVYWGYDSSGSICQAVVQFIDVELTYGED